MEPQVSSQPGRSPGRCRSRSPYETYFYFRRSIKVMAELFAYRVVLNGIVLASSTQETVFAVYMTYRPWPGASDTSAGADRCERQSAAICLFLSIRIKSSLIDDRLVYRQLARLHGGAHHLIVSLRLIGICPGECGECEFEGVALPKIPTDPGGVAGSGMGPRQRPSAHVGGVNQPLCPECFYFRAFFHITQLPDVIVTPARLSAPAEEGVARGLEQSLTRHNTLPHVFISAPAHEWLQRGAAGLLDLQDKRVFVAGHEQNDSATRPHAAYAGYLHGHVHDIEALQEEAQVVGYLRLVRFEGLAEIRFEGVSFRRVKKERRLVGDAGPAVHHPHVLGEEMLRCLLAGFGDHLLAALARSGVARLGDEGVDVNAGVEHIHRFHPRELEKALAVRPPDGQYSLLAVGLAQPYVSPLQVETRPKTLNVPLPRARNRFVKIHQVEYQPPFGRGETAKVAQVAVAAQLYAQAAHRGRSKIEGHGPRRTAEEREGRG